MKLVAHLLSLRAPASLAALALVLTLAAPAHAQLGSPGGLNVLTALRDNYGWEQAFAWPQGSNPTPIFGENWPGVAAPLGTVTQISVTAGAVKPV